MIRVSTIRRLRVTGLLALALVSGCTGNSTPPDAPSVVDTAIKRDASNWLMSGGDWTGSYYSALKKIDAGNIGKLGLAWEYDLNSNRGQESTPVMVDGILYVSTNWGRVVAIDAVTGAKKWAFDPEVNGLVGRNACCDVVNRGLSVHKGKVYVGAFDGRLIALDAKTGKSLWQADTIIDHSKMYSIAGAPQVAGKVVVIGNSGGVA